MNKMKKLLSVLLAVVLAFSGLTVLGSAAKTEYQTVDNLNTLGAYSPYGQVTRLSTEERTSIILDALDNLLAKANINLGEVFSLNLLIATFDLTINLTSVDNLCLTLDDAADLLGNGLVSLAMAIVNLGILEYVDLDPWATGMSRAGTAQYTILSELLEVVSAQDEVINQVLGTGTLDLGIVSLGDMSAIENIIGDIPGMIKSLVFPMLERKDDTLADIRNLDTWGTGDGNVNIAVNTFVQNLFVDNRSTTTVKYDANGNMTSEHTGLPIVTTDPTTTTPSDSSLRYVYYKDADGKLWTCHIVDQAEADASVEDATIDDLTAYTYVKEEVPYELKEEVPGWADTPYTWQATDAWGNTWTLKYMNDDSPWLPSLKDAIEAGTVSIDLASDSISAGDLLYTFIPYVFQEMAPVVLNGSMKKILGGLFGATYKYVGEVGSDEVNALADASNAFFTQEQGEYLWEWSDYAVINGTHYYRFEDQIFVGDTSNANHYFSVINWDYKITDDFMNEFVPADDSDTSDRLLLNLNDFLVKVVNTVIAESATWTYQDKTTTWTRPALATGGNANLIPNIKLVAQTFIKHAPEHIFGSDYATNDRCYYNLLISEDNDTVLTGIAAQLVDMIMPSMYLPGAGELVASNAKVGAILAAVIREFAGELIAEYDYDALIYVDYGTTTGDPDKTFVDPENYNGTSLLSEGSTASGYWFDVILTMGMDAGYEYLRAFSDMGEDTEYCAGAVNAGYDAAGKTYAAGTTQAQLNAQWEGMLDYIIDWALEGSLEWTWKFDNIVDTSSFTVDLATAQDPWVKLDTIIDSLFPVIEEILDVTPTDCDTQLEQFLRYDLILGIVDLEWDSLIATLAFDGSHFRTGNILNQLADLLKSIVNNIFKYVGNSSHNYALIPDAITNFDELANQANITTLVTNLVGTLYTAGVTNKGCETIIPFLNFLLGWKTDPQNIADPVMWTTFRDNNDYAFQYNDSGSAVTAVGGAINSTYINFLNNSAGMLEIHRDSSVTDHAYEINIRSVTSDATVNTLTFSYDDVCSPYETVVIEVGGTYGGEEAVTVTVAYDYIGKDGAAVGGTQYTSFTFFISNQYEDANIDGRFDGDEDEDYAGINQYKAYQFTEDIVATATADFEIYATQSTTGATSSKSFSSITAPDNETDCDGNVTTSHDMAYLAPDAFDYCTTQSDSGWPDTKPAEGSIYGKLYKVTNANATYEYGTYDMGRIAVKYGSDSKVWDIVYTYYNDYDIYNYFTDNRDNGYNANQGVDASIYNEYNEAWQDIVKYATYPMMTQANGHASTDYVLTIQPYIPAAIERYEAAKEAYELALAEADANANAGADAALPASIAALEVELAKDGWTMNPAITVTEDEINYQDYEYYEYFNYADLRTEGRDLVRTYYAPEILDTYYIEGSGIREAELNNVIAAEDNSIIAAGITASRKTNDANAIADSVTARAEWTQPLTNNLYVYDLTARIAYYKQFLQAENDDHAVFLDREIAHCEAQQFRESDYTADSWAAYAEALANAKEISAEAAAGLALNSDIKSRQWNLMVARKNLLKVDDSLIENGGTATLAANAAIAEDIFASLEAQDGAWAVKEGVDANAAYAALISALGYYYVGEDGETYNLYADSAYEYLDNDRPNRSSNQTKVNASNANLEAALANFEAAAEEMEPSTLIVREDFEYADYVVIDTNNTNNGEYTGIVYGIDTLDQNPDFAPLTDLLGALTTNNGDDYLVIEANEQGVESTGATITVVDENGDALETYVFVYFGDIDGDGMITSSDDFIASEYEVSYEGINSYAEYVAADIDADGMVTSSDGFVMSEFEVSYEGVDYQYNIGQNAVNNTYEWIF